MSLASRNLIFAENAFFKMKCLFYDVLATVDLKSVVMAEEMNSALSLFGIGYLYQSFCTALISDCQCLR